MKRASAERRARPSYIRHATALAPGLIELRINGAGGARVYEAGRQAQVQMRRARRRSVSCAPKL